MPDVLLAARCYGEVVEKPAQCQEPVVGWPLTLLAVTSRGVEDQTVLHENVHQGAVSSVIAFLEERFEGEVGCPRAVVLCDGGGSTMDYALAVGALSRDVLIVRPMRLRTARDTRCAQALRNEMLV